MISNNNVSIKKPLRKLRKKEIDNNEFDKHIDSLLLYKKKRTTRHSSKKRTIRHSSKKRTTRHSSKKRTTRHSSKKRTTRSRKKHSTDSRKKN